MNTQEVKMQMSLELEQVDKMFNPSKTTQFQEDIKRSKDDMRYEQNDTWCEISKKIIV